MLDIIGPVAVELDPTTACNVVLLRRAWSSVADPAGFAPLPPETVVLVNTPDASNAATLLNKDALLTVIEDTVNFVIVALETVIVETVSAVAVTLEGHT